MKKLYISLNGSYEHDPRCSSGSECGRKVLINALKPYSIQRGDNLLEEWSLIDAEEVNENLSKYKIINTCIQYSQDSINKCSCICGRELTYLFPVKNDYMDEDVIAFIGSHCVYNFDDSMITTLVKSSMEALGIYTCIECEKIIRKKFDWHKKVRKHKGCLTLDEGFQLFGPPYFVNGKYEGMSVEIIYKKDPSYCKWFVRNCNPENCSNHSRLIYYYLKNLFKK